MRFCIIASDTNDHAPNKIKEEVEKAGHEAFITLWRRVSLVLDGEKICFELENGQSLDDFDFVVPRSGRCWKVLDGHKALMDYTFLLRIIASHEISSKFSLLNGEYYRFFSGIDKLTQQFFFFSNNLPGIETSFSGNILDEDKDSYPVIIKTIKGSRGDGVEKIDNKQEWEKFVLENKKNPNFFIKQKYYPIKADYRVIVLGDRVLGGVLRTPKNDSGWKTNFSAGGTVERFEVKGDLKKIAIKTAKLMKIDYVGIDFLHDGDNFKIIETNALAQFEGFESVNDVNVAKEIVDYMIKNK